MPAIIPEEFYKANIDKEKEYVCIYIAYAVKAGQERSIGGRRVTAEEDGYDLSGAQEFTHKAFMNNETFAAKTTPAAGLELLLPKKDLDEEGLQILEPVRKGDWIFVDEGLSSRRMVAYRDGFSLQTRQAQKIFMTNFQLTSAFNYAGQKHETEKEIVVTLKDEAPLRGIILGEETTFDFNGDNYTAAAGCLIYPDPRRENGYLLKGTIPNADLRVWKSPHDLATERQAALNARVMRVKLH